MKFREKTSIHYEFFQSLLRKKMGQSEVVPLPEVGEVNSNQNHLNEEEGLDWKD